VTADRIYSWYAGELASLGWRPTGTDPINGSRTYGRHAGESFRVEADIYSDYLHTSLPYNGTGMVYSIDYRNGSCPSPKARCVLVGSDAPPSVPGAASASGKALVRPASYQELISRLPDNLYFPGAILVGRTVVAEGRNPQLGYDPAGRAETSVVVKGASPDSLAAWFAPRVAADGWQPIESVASSPHTLSFMKPDGEGLQLSFGEVGGALAGYGLQGTPYSLAYEIFPCHEASTPCYLYPPKGSLVLDEHTDGATLTASIGSLITVALRDPGWKFNPLVNPTLVPVAGPGGWRPTDPAKCELGGDCYAVVMVYRAVNLGSTDVLATEATDPPTTYDLRVVVHADGPPVLALVGRPYYHADLAVIQLPEGATISMRFATQDWSVHEVAGTSLTEISTFTYAVTGHEAAELRGQRSGCTQDPGCDHSIDNFDLVVDPIT
jgi:hypothetical protein